MDAVLDEEWLAEEPAGVILQAYLPDPGDVLRAEVVEVTSGRVEEEGLAVLADGFEVAAEKGGA